MKIALISFNTYKPIFPPLGLLYLANFIQNKLKDIEIKIIDANFDNIENSVDTFKPDLIGLTAMTNDYGKAINFAKKYKAKSHIPIIIGGVHITTLPSSFKNCFDLAVLGEGENTFFEIISLYQKNQSLTISELENIKGLLFRKNDKIIQTEKRELIKNLDELPHLNRRLLNPNYFNKQILINGEYGIQTDLIVSRGCPYDCVFCSTSLFWQRRIRFHSNEYIVKEIKDIYHNYNASYIYVPDDLFIYQKEKVIELIELLKKENLLGKISFGIQLRVDLVDSELLDLLKELNVIRIGFGLESGSDKILKYLKNQKITIEDSKKAVQLCVEKGFLTGSSLMFAIPRETIEDMNQTLKFMRFLKNLGLFDLSSFVLTPYPGTKIWEIAKERGKVNNNMDWQSITQNDLAQAKNPLLLDDSVDYKKYLKFFKERGEIMKEFKLKNLKRDFKKHPFINLKRALFKPKTALKIIFKRWIY